MQDMEGALHFLSANLRVVLEAAGPSAGGPRIDVDALSGRIVLTVPCAAAAAAAAYGSGATLNSDYGVLALLFSQVSTLSCVRRSTCYVLI